MPLSAARLRERGFNQALEIARAVLRRHRRRARHWPCERVRDTPAQVDLPLAERRANVRGAFRCPRPLRGTRVAVVDDVMTTGARWTRSRGVLKRAGAARVVNWVVARTLARVT